MRYSSTKLSNDKVITTACNVWRQIACSFQVMGGNILFLGKKIFEIPPFFQTRPGDLGKKVHACSLRFSALNTMMSYTVSQVSWTAVISAIVAVRGATRKTAPIIIVKLKTALHANKVLRRVNKDVLILPYGRNQTEAVTCVDVNFMGRRVLQTISYNMRLSTKIWIKWKGNWSKT